MIRFLLGLVGIASVLQCSAQYKLEFNIEGLPDSTVLLLKYKGDQMYYADTSESKNGKVIFEKDHYDGGIYAFYTGKSYFEFVMADKEVVINSTHENMPANVKIKKSEENKVFYEYMKFISQARTKAEGLNKQIADLDEEKDKNKIDILNQQRMDLDKSVKTFQKDLVKQHEGKLISKILNMSVDVEIPESVPDSLKGIYLRDHYWDNIDLKDARLAHSPVFSQKLGTYFKKMMHQIPDTIVHHASKMIDQIEDSSDMMQLVLNYVHKEYETSNIMGMDAVYVKMSELYYCPPAENKAWWYPQKNLDDRCERAAKLKPLLIGALAPDLSLADESGEKWKSIHKIKGEYKAIIFWDPDCGHCKKELPKLKKLYDELKEKNLDVEFIGIGTNLENEKWVEMIKEKELNWINLSDTPDANKNPGKYVYEKRVTDVQSLNFRKTYDIFSTPQIYLLDNKNTIVGKRLDANNMARMIERLMETELDYKEEKKDDKNANGASDH